MMEHEKSVFIIKPFQKYECIKFRETQNVKSNLAFKFPLNPSSNPKAPNKWTKCSPFLWQTHNWGLLLKEGKNKQTLLEGIHSQRAFTAERLSVYGRCYIKCFLIKILLITNTIFHPSGHFSPDLCGYSFSFLSISLLVLVQDRTVSGISYRLMPGFAPTSGIEILK